MKKKKFLLIALLVGVAVGAYLVGYYRSPALKRLESESRFRISLGLRLYESLQKGDVEKAREDVRFVLWGDTATYERMFGPPSGTNSFARKFAEAKAVTAGVEDNLKSNSLKLQRAITDLFQTNG